LPLAIVRILVFLLWDRSIKRIILMNILISWMVLEIMKFH
jgi:hypothetical protein